MSEEQQGQSEQPQQTDAQELDAGQSFNLLVNLARQSKLSYDEHALVDKAVKKLAEELNI